MKKNENIRKEYHLKGLKCANCAAKLEKGVNQIEGIENANVNFATATLTATVNEAKEALVEEEIVNKVNRIEPTITVQNKTTTQSAFKEETNNHHHSTNKNALLRIILSFILLMGGLFLPLSASMTFILFLTAYLIIGGDVLFRATRNIIRGQVFDENFLMAIATVGAFAIGQFPEGVAVMLFYQVGEYFQELAVNRSRKSISDLMDIRPDYAFVKQNDTFVKVAPEQVRVDDIIQIKPGEKIPLDGIVIEGQSMVDTSALTGESMPRNVEKDSTVLGGFINTNGVLFIRVTKRFSESTVSKILELVENTSSRKAPTENFITKFARYYTPVVVAIALGLALLPPLILSSATFSDWIYRALIFLVISCPCALVVSIPLGFFGGIGAASKKGILVKGSHYLEALNAVKYVVFDKTGTLTKGTFAVTEIVPAPQITQEQLLKIAAHAEIYSNHPIALSIKKAYNEPLDERNIENYEEISGHGIRVCIGNKDTLAGNSKLMKQFNISFSEPKTSGTIIYLAQNHLFAGYIVISDQLKPDAKETIYQLKQHGIKKTVMLTGDAKVVGEEVAQKLKIDEVKTELLPQDKVEQIEKIMQTKRNSDKVIFVGDGINDTPVLARADIGVAMGGLGSDAAIEAADVVIMNDKPSRLPVALKIARRTRKIVWQNIIFALTVKGIFLLLGALGIATMWEAVFSDVGVTLLSVLNATRILWGKNTAD